MKKSKFFLFIPLAVLLISSCRTYKPGYINSPTFEEGGEVYLDLNAGSNFGGNVSFSPLKNVGILANYSTAFAILGERSAGFVNQDEQMVERYEYESYFYELAGGANWNYSDQLYHDFYIGFGRGLASKIENPVFDVEGQRIKAFQGDFDNVFIQTSLKGKLDEYFSVSFDYRVNLLNFSSFNYVYDLERINSNNHRVLDQSEIDLFFDMRNQQAHQLGLTFDFTSDYVNLYTQFQLAFSPDYYTDHFYDVRFFNFFVGVSAPIHRLWKTKDQ